jgi:hypothetical protein
MWVEAGGSDKHGGAFGEHEKTYIITTHKYIQGRRHDTGQEAR